MLIICYFLLHTFIKTPPAYLISENFPTPPFIKTPPFIYFLKIFQPPRLLRPPPVYLALKRICNRKYCDFFMWTNIDYHIERIVPDKDLLSSIIDKCQYIFRVAILPELVGKFFSRVESATTENYSNEHNVYCYCKGNEPGELFPCSNKECKIKLFHLVCVQLKYKPKRKWLCPDCRKAKASSEVNEKMSLEKNLFSLSPIKNHIVFPDSPRKQSLKELGTFNKNINITLLPA